MQGLERFWDCIPIGRENAIQYEQLEWLWNMSNRRVREILAELSCFDNGDNYILIRSSRGGGFYLTDDPDDIAAYRREVYSRAIKTFAPLKKINRVQRDTAPEAINYSFTNNLRLKRLECGMTQAQVVTRMKYFDSSFDESMLSKFENGYALPTPKQLHALASILNCEPFVLVGGLEYGLIISSDLSGLQVP